MAIVLASVIGSDSTGSATAVDSPILVVTAAAVASETHGSRVRGVAVVGQGLVAGAGVRGGPLDRDVGVLGDVERVEAPLLGRPWRAPRG